MCTIYVLYVQTHKRTHIYVSIKSYLLFRFRGSQLRQTASTHSTYNIVTMACNMAQCQPNASSKVNTELYQSILSYY